MPRSGTLAQGEVTPHLHRSLAGALGCHSKRVLLCEKLGRAPLIADTFGRHGTGGVRRFRCPAVEPDQGQKVRDR